jgi:hypothetical protein
MYERFTELVINLARTSNGAAEFMRRLQANGFTTAGGSLTFGRIYQLGCIKVVLGVLEHKADDKIWHLSLCEQPGAPIVDIIDEGKLLV